MIQILREFIENEKQITEYTRDGVTASHRVEVPLQQETAGEVLELPPNPFIQAQQDIVDLQAQNAQMIFTLVMNDLM